MSTETKNQSKPISNIETAYPGLQKMEAIIQQAANGIHILFDKEAISEALKGVKNDHDFYDFDKVKDIQDSMTTLISKNSLFEKQAYLQSLPKEKYHLIIRAYLHIIENNVLASQQKH